MPITLGSGALGALRTAAGALFRGGSGVVSRGAIPAARGAIVSGARVLGPAIAGGAAYGAASSMFGGGQPAGYGRGMRRRRAKGITAAELRGARKVAKLVRMYGYRPKAGKIHARRR